MRAVREGRSVGKKVREGGKRIQTGMERQQEGRSQEDKMLAGSYVKTDTGRKILGDSGQSGWYKKRTRSNNH